MRRRSAMNDRILSEDDRVGAGSLHSRERGIKFSWIPYGNALHHYPQGLRRALCVAQVRAQRRDSSGSRRKATR